jgi:peptidyl-prolyl isomerase H (cyclophilin H)
MATDVKRHRAEVAVDVLDAVPIVGVTRSNPGNPVVFLDFSIGGKQARRVKLELFLDRVPKTSENFRQLCTGETLNAGLPAGYKGSPIHRVVPGVIVQGGDFIRRDGTGTHSIYGDFFEDEETGLSLKHDGPGVLSMANVAGTNRAGCQFVITLDSASALDGKHVVFGRVVDGMEVVRDIARVPLTAGFAPVDSVVIVECGEL